MANSHQSAVIQPGSDSVSHVRALHQSVSTHLSNLTGSKVDLAEVVPVSQQHPVPSSVVVDLDLADMIAGEKGQVRSEPSRNFLKVLFNKVRRKNPDKEIRY